jgi:hypothetical protein
MSFLKYYLMMFSVLKLYSISDKMINEYGTVDGINVGRWNQSTQRNPLPLQLSPP